MPLYTEPTFWQTVANLFLSIGLLLAYAVALLARHALMIIWVVWWLWAVNWPRCWHALARGGWAPAVLLMLISALVWSRLEPGPNTYLGVVTIPSFWWQLGDVALLAGVALFCGWVQGVMHWTPVEIDLAPPAHSHGHHADGHAGH